MSQFQQRTGPITNNAAAFSPEMAQGVTSPRPRGGLGPKIALPLFIFIAAPVLDATFTACSVDAEPRLRAIAEPQQIAPPEVAVVAPPFDYESIVGGHADKRGARLSRPQSRIPDFIADFDFASVLGSQSEYRSRLTKPQHRPPLDNPHIAAPFGIEQVQHSRPQAARLPRLTRLPVPDLVFLAPDAGESVFGSRLDSRNHLTRPQHLQPLAQLDLYSFESILGSELDRRGLRFKNPQHPQPLSQTTHVQSAFSAAEMVVSGSTVTRARLPKISQLNLPDLPHVQAFSFDSVLASRLDFQSRLRRPQHLAPIYQPTHVQAAFSSEMVQATFTPRTRLHVIQRPPLSPLIQVDPFSFESVLGSRLDFRGHLTRPQHLVVGIVQVDRFTFDSVLGSRLDERGSRFRNPQHILQLAQTTHVVAAFSEDMVRGSIPWASRLPFIPRPFNPNYFPKTTEEVEAIPAPDLELDLILCRVESVTSEIVRLQAVMLPVFRSESVESAITRTESVSSEISRSLTFEQDFTQKP